MIANFLNWLDGCTQIEYYMILILIVIVPAIFWVHGFGIGSKYMYKQIKEILNSNLKTEYKFEALRNLWGNK